MEERDNYKRNRTKIDWEIRILMNFVRFRRIYDNLIADCFIHVIIAAEWRDKVEVEDELAVHDRWPQKIKQQTNKPNREKKKRGFLLN